MIVVMVAPETETEEQFQTLNVNKTRAVPDAGFVFLPTVSTPAIVDGSKWFNRSFRTFYTRTPLYIPYNIITLHSFGGMLNLPSL